MPIVAAAARALERWSQPGALRAREVAVAFLALAALAAVVYAPHVRSGGFYSDDWASAATYRFAPEPRYRNAARVQRAILGGRPGLAYAQPLPHAVFGERPAAHIAAAVALGVALALAFFALLRVLGLGFLPALAVAGLSLVFPWADSARLWPIAGLNQLSPLLWALGALVALRGLRTGGAAGGVWHAGALALYALALLTYEAVGGLVLATGLLYVLSRRAPRGRALARWGADAVVALALLAWSRRETGEARELASPSQVLDDAPRFAGEALELAGQALVPVRGWGPVAGVVVAAIVVLLFARGRHRDPAARRWMGVAAVAALGTAAALAPFVGSGLHPLDEGLNNRGNLAAALPLSALAFAVLALAGIGLAPGAGRSTGGGGGIAPRGGGDTGRRETPAGRAATDAEPGETTAARAAPATGRGETPAGRAAIPAERRETTAGRAATAALAITTALALVLGAAYAYRVRGDIVLWDRAAAGQERVLDRLAAALPRPPRGAVAYAYGQPLVVSPGVSIFSQPWDLSSAVRLRYDDAALGALPLAQGVVVVCGLRGLHPQAPPGPWGTLQGGYGPAHGAPYGRAVLFDAVSGRVAIPRDEADCRRAVRRVEPAPFAGDPR